MGDVIDLDKHRSPRQYLASDCAITVEIVETIDGEPRVFLLAPPDDADGYGMSAAQAKELAALLLDSANELERRRKGG